MLNCLSEAWYYFSLSLRALQYDGTLPDDLKQIFKEKAQARFLSILTSEESIKSAILSRQSIFIGIVNITKDELDQIELNKLLNTSNLSIDERIQSFGNEQFNGDQLAAVVCESAIWEAINSCGSPYFFSKIHDYNVCYDAENWMSLKNNIESEIRASLIEKYKSLDNPIKKFEQASTAYSHLELYQYLNYSLIVAATLTIVCGSFISLPCLIVGFLMLVTSMYIHHVLNDEIENAQHPTCTNH